MIAEKKLIDQCKQGNQAAHKRLFGQYASQLFGVCLRYTDTRVEAEDIFQDGFITVFKKIEQYKGDGSFAGWMRRIMVTTALMHHRKAKSTGHTVELTDAAEGKYVDSSIEPSDPDPNDIKAVIENADFSREELLEITNDLPDGYRMVFNLVVVEGYKHREVADMLGIAESTSKTQLLKARKVLQKMLHEAALNKNKIRKPERVLALAFIVMEGDLKYIDKILGDGLGNLQATPSTDWAGISGKMAEQAVSSSSGVSSSLTNSGLQQGTGIVVKIGTNVVKFVTSQLHTVTTMVVASAFSLGVLTQSTGPADNNLLNHVAVLPVTEEVNNEISDETEPEKLLSTSSLISIESIDNEDKLIRGDVTINVPVDDPVVIDTVTVPIKKEKIVKIKRKVLVKDTVVVERRMRR